MECEVTRAKPLNYCGEELVVGTMADDQATTVFLKDLATERTVALSNSGEDETVSVTIPPLLPGHTYSLHLLGDKPFTIAGMTTAITSVMLTFDKVFTSSGEVVSESTQTITAE